MTLVEYYQANKDQLRQYLMGEKARVEGAIRQASVDGKMDVVDDLRPELDEIVDDIGLADAVALNQIVAAKLALPDLPPDFRVALQNGKADLARWQALQGAIAKSIAIAGQVADGVQTIAALAIKYGKFLA